jgi:hypothetical protein
METLETVLNGIQRNSYFTSCDMTDAYFSIPIHNDYKKYLKFIETTSKSICQVLYFRIHVND